MHFSTSLALGFIAASTSAHMIMTTPVPFGKSTLNNSPLLADGSDYPCKLRGTTFALESASNIMAAGSSQSLHFQGTAVHGGGSCQVSIAMLPSGATLSMLSDSDAKALNFKVIHSIVGGCPEQNMVGNSEDPAAAAAVDPSTYAFTIPDSVPAGNATLAWTWFNKVGNREMYMNCAPVTITSSTSKRSDEELQVRDTAAFSALPDMFTANIGNSCTTQDSKDVVFPNPGGSVASMGGSSASSATATPTGAGCQSAGSLLATGVVASAPSVASSAVASKASSSASASSAGGVFVTTPASTSVSVAAAKPTATPFSTAAAASPTSSTSATAAVAKTSSSSAAAAAATTSTSSSFGPMTPGSPCTTEGMFNCVPGTSFQQCASGTWSVVQSLADGTQCVVGQTMAIDITVSAKRGVSSAKFPRGHLRRHLGGGGN